MHYPDTVLTALEREPVVYWGCTWSEIIRSSIRGAVISLSFTLILALIPLPITKTILAVPMLIMWAFVTKRTMNKISKLRSGKPLFFDKHVQMIKRHKNVFINPNDLKQCERN